MSTLYGIYLAEAWKPRVAQEPHSVSPAANSKRRKRKKEMDQHMEEEEPDRSLLIQGKIICNKRSETCVPEIKLSGVWLGRLGFEPGMRVRVSTQHRKLIIEVDEESIDAQSVADGSMSSERN